MTFGVAPQPPLCVRYCLLEEGLCKVEEFYDLAAHIVGEADRRCCCLRLSYSLLLCGLFKGPCLYQVVWSSPRHAGERFEEQRDVVVHRDRLGEEARLLSPRYRGGFEGMHQPVA